MIINLKRTFIRIIIIIIIILFLCKLGIFIRENNKLLKFYSYKTKQLKTDKLDELNDIDSLNKQLIKNEKKYNIYKNNFKSNMNSYNKVRKSCTNQKLKFIGKISNLTRNINENINTKFNIWGQSVKFLGGQNNNICPFPDFQNSKGDNKCCPKSFSNTKVYANNKRCSTDIISDRSHENLGNPINSCKNAKGYVSKIGDNYICTSYLKSLIGGDGWIQLGQWRLGYTKHSNDDNNNKFFTICSSQQNKNILIIDEFLEIYENLILNQDALYTLPILDNVENIIVGDGFIQFGDIWRFGYFDDDNLLLSPYENTSYCWTSNGNRKKVDYSLWNKENRSSNIYFDGKGNLIRFGLYWYVGHYDDNHFSISNKLTNITNITYISTETREEDNYELVLEYKDCKLEVDKGKAITDSLFKKSNVFKYETNGETIFYHRISHVPVTLSIYDLMINSFNSKNNIINKDFKLYSNYLDYRNNTNAWSVCDYNIFTNKVYDDTIAGRVKLPYYGPEQTPCNEDEFITKLEPGEGYYYNRLDGTNYPNRDDKLSDGSRPPGPYKRDGLCRKVSLENSNKIKNLADNFKKDDWSGLDVEEQRAIGYGKTYLAKPDEHIGFPANCGSDSIVLNRWARNSSTGKPCSSARDFKFSVLKVNIRTNNSVEGPHNKFSLNNKPVLEEFSNINALEPDIEDIRLEDIDTELRINVDNNCPFQQLKNSCIKGKDCLYKRCCPIGFNNTKYNANYKQCGSDIINDVLKLNCEKSNGYITENIIEINNPNLLNNEKKIVYNCVNKIIENKNQNNLYYFLLILLIIGSIFIYTKFNKKI